MAYNTIKLKKYADVIEEYAAASTITPGMLIALGSGGTVAAHAHAAQDASPMFALEDELQGKGIDDNYIAGDQVQCWIPGRGDQVYAILEDGENVSVGDFLESNGAGYLQKHVADAADSDDAITIYPLAIVAIALEAKDLSGSSGEESSGALGHNKRIAVRIV